MAILVSSWPPLPLPPAPWPPGTLYTLLKEMHPWFSSHLSSSQPPPPIKYLARVVGEAHITVSSLSLICYLSHCFSQLCIYTQRQQGDGRRRWAPEIFRFYLGLPSWVALPNVLKSQLGRDGLTLSSVKSVPGGSECLDNRFSVSV